MPLSRTSLLVLLAAACSGAPDATGPGRGDAPPLPGAGDTLSAQLSAAERLTVTESNAFGLGLFQRVSARRARQNVFISPYSAAVALGMTLNGAAGTTADAMAATLGFAGQPLPQIDAAYRALNQRLVRADTSVRFESANSIWYEKTFPFSQTFFDTTARYFGAEVQALDFRDEQGSLARINGWAKDRTNGRIEKVLDEIRADDQVMFLLNAVYFKGDWTTPFDSRQTAPAEFTRADGAKQTVDMMTQRSVHPVWRTSDLTAVELPYGKGAFSMVVLVPAAGRSVDDVVASLGPTKWQQVVDSLKPQDMQLYLPRFTMRYEDEWKDVLTAMGMGIAFTPGQADFTRMSTRGRELYIEFVKQNTFVGVNEKGTEAGAVTTVGIGLVSLPPQVRVDRAFVMVIREKATGALLFAGKVASI